MAYQFNSREFGWKTATLLDFHTLEAGKKEKTGTLHLQFVQGGVTYTRRNVPQGTTGRVYRIV